MSFRIIPAAWLLATFAKLWSHFGQHQQLVRRHRHIRRSDNSRQLEVQPRGSQVICCKQFASLARAHGRGLDGIRNAAAFGNDWSPPISVVSFFVFSKHERQSQEILLPIWELFAAGVTLCCASQSALWECDAFRKQSRGQPLPKGYASSVVARKRRCVAPSHEN